MIVVATIQVTKPWTLPLLSADYNGYWEASSLRKGGDIIDESFSNPIQLYTYTLLI